MARALPRRHRSPARHARRPRLADQRARRRDRRAVRRLARCTACCGRSATATWPTLDSAEGVPVRYRRDRMTVHTDDGPARGVGVHRPPRRAGRAADPATWSGSSTAPCTTGCRSAGSTSSTAGIRSTGHASWRCQRIRLRRSRFRNCWPDPDVTEPSTLRSRFGFLAIHGGGLEKMTDVIAERAARRRRRVGLRGAPPRPTIRTICRPRRTGPTSPTASPSSSTTSTWWCRCTATAASDRSTQLLAGGGNRALAAHLAHHVVGAGLSS